MNYGRPCQFLGICSGHDTPQGSQWVERKSVHGELKDIEGDGRGVLTYSRLSCFQTCKRKHYYKYELGIEKVNEEVSEPLHFGTLMHSSLEEWWNNRKGETHADSNPVEVAATHGSQSQYGEGEDPF